MNRKEFERCTPEEVGIPSSAIHRLLDELEAGGFTQMHGIMIMRHSKVCAEGWWAPYAPQLHHALHSLSKTYTSTAVGLAEYEGLLSLTDRVADILPDKMPAEMSDHLQRITVRDLLTMADGGETEADNYRAEWLQDYFARPLLHEPGTFWRYNSHTTAVLSAIVERLSGQSMMNFLKPRLFDKLGIDAQHVLCRRGWDGTCLGGHGMFTTTEDNLRLMKLYLDGGIWEGERLLNERYVQEATTARMDTAPAHAHTPWIYDNRCGYGYQMWMCRPEGSFRADGAYGQFSIVVPSLDLIVSINEGGHLGENMGHSRLHLLRDVSEENHPVHGPQSTLNAVFDVLLPAIQTGTDELPPSREALLLKERMNRLSIGRPAPHIRDWTYRPLQAELVSEEKGISFRMMYGMGRYNNAARAGAEKIMLRTEDGSLHISLTENGVERELIADMRGGWATGKLTYTDNLELVSDVAAAAWWEPDGSLQLDILWYETENENRFSFCFEGDRVSVREWVHEGSFGKGAVEDSAVYRVIK